MANVITGEFASQIAAAAGNPNLPESGAGIYTVYANHRYQLVRRSGQYIATDISVYTDDGTLLTDPTDVWIYELGGLAGDVQSGVASMSTGFLIGAAILGILFLWKR